jgi:hypothetical protein
MDKPETYAKMGTRHRMKTKKKNNTEGYKEKQHGYSPLFLERLDFFCYIERLHRSWYVHFVLLTVSSLVCMLVYMLGHPYHFKRRDRRGRDRMIIGFTINYIYMQSVAITTNVAS